MKIVKVAYYKLKPNGPRSYSTESAPPGLMIKSWEQGRVYSTNKREFVEWLEAQGVFRITVEWKPEEKTEEAPETSAKASQGAPSAESKATPASKPSKPAEAKGEPAAKAAKTAKAKKPSKAKPKEGQASPPKAKKPGRPKKKK